MMTVIREAVRDDITAIARVHVDTWRSTYTGIVPDQVLANLSYEKRARSWHQVFDNASEVGGFTYLAENDSGQVVGFADGGSARSGNLNYKGELNAIYILESYQNKGLGRELVRLAAQKLLNMEIQSLLTWVLEANPACNFYEALGGQCVQRKDIEMGGRNLSEIAYGWEDISVLSK